MVFAILNVLIFLGLLAYLFLVEKKREPLLSLGLWDGLKETPKFWKSKSHWILLSCFAFFLLLPLTFGLSVYLKTDANVLVVIVWVIWTYNWVKYAFWRE